MAFFAGLLGIALLIMMISRIFGFSSFKAFWNAARLSAAIMFVQVGIIHFVNPEALTYMISDFMPFATELVILSGMAEIILGVGLLWPPAKVLSAWLLISLLIAMFPANIYVAVNHLPAPGGLPAEPWYLWSRLIFQPIYIYWVWRASIYKKEGFSF